jgi:hypothetical protein
MYALLVGARADDDSALNAGAAYVLFIEGEINSSVESIVVQEDFSYSNPVQNQLYIWQSIGQLTLNIYDMNGRLVQSEALSTMEAAINVQSLAKGVYIGVMQKGAYRKSFKFIKE